MPTSPRLQTLAGIPSASGSRLGEADAFTIDSLLKLTHTRTTITSKSGKKETVLDYIISHLLRRGEGDVVRGLAEDLADLSKAWRLDEQVSRFVRRVGDQS